MTKLMGLGVLLAMLSGCTMAQEKAAGRIVVFTIKDMRAAGKSADPVWAKCFNMLADDLEAKAQSQINGVEVVGLFSLIAKAHDAKAMVKGGGLSRELEVACQPVAMDVLMFVAEFGAGAFPGVGSVGSVFR